MSEAAPPRRRTKHPEHNLQVQCKKWAEACISCPSFFIGTDRGKKTSAFSHVREAARGIRAGTSDTLVLWPGGTLFVELKIKPNKPSDAQIQFAARVNDLGALHRARTAYSVQEFYEHCLHAGIPLRPMAALQAEHLDRLLAGAPLRVRGPVRPAKPRAARASRRALDIARDSRRP